MGARQLGNFPTMEYNAFFTFSGGGYPIVENRLETRASHRLELMYGSNDTFCPGTALNLSPHGMRIHAESQMVPIAREIKLVMTLDRTVVSMRGIVCWNSEVLELDPEAERHLGVFIPDPPLDYVDYVNHLG